MNKATFVNEIPNEIKGNEVPTLSLVKSMIPESKVQSNMVYIGENYCSNMYALLCPIKEEASFFNGCILFGSVVFQIYIFCINNEIRICRIMQMATGDEGTSITHMCLAKITTDEGIWVGFSAPENTGGKHYVYDYHSSDEIKIIDQNENTILSYETLYDTEKLPLNFDYTYDRNTETYHPYVGLLHEKITLWEDKIKVNGKNVSLDGHTHTDLETKITALESRITALEGKT